MTLYQFSSGYRYTSDAMHLYDFISSLSVKGEVLDLGCGCGILGLLIKRDFPNISLTSLDIQPEHIELTIKNSKENNLETRVIQEDFKTYKSDKKFDFIISNPPFYLKNTKKSIDDRLRISRYADNLPLKAFFTNSYKLLNSKGSLCFCYDASQLQEIIYELECSKLKLCDICFVHPRENKESSLVLIRARKDSKTLATIHPPLIIHAGDDYTKRVKDIFLKANTKSKTCQS